MNTIKHVTTEQAVNLGDNITVTGWIEGWDGETPITLKGWLTVFRVRKADGSRNPDGSSTSEPLPYTDAKLKVWGENETVVRLSDEIEDGNARIEIEMPLKYGDLRAFQVAFSGDPGYKVAWTIDGERGTIPLEGVVLSEYQRGIC